MTPREIEILVGLLKGAAKLIELCRDGSATISKDDYEEVSSAVGLANGVLHRIKQERNP